MARYVDSVNGNDTNGNGTISQPFQTLLKARNSITDQSAAKIYTVVILNTGFIMEPAITNWAPFINLLGPGMALLNIMTSITVVADVGREGLLQVQGTSIFGGLSYDGSSATQATLILVNVAVGGLLFRADPNHYGGLVTEGSVLSANTVVRGNFYARGTDIYQSWLIEEATSDPIPLPCSESPTKIRPFTEIVGGSLHCSEGTITGASVVILAGCVPARSITGQAVSGRTPVLQTDPGSIPGKLSGSITLTLAGQVKYVGYTSAAPQQWAGTAPGNAGDALDRLAAVVYALRSNSPIP